MNSSNAKPHLVVVTSEAECDQPSVSTQQELLNLLGGMPRVENIREKSTAPLQEAARTLTVRVTDNEGNFRTLEAITVDIMKLAVEENLGVLSRTATVLDIGRSTIHRYAKKYDF